MTRPRDRLDQHEFARFLEAAPSELQALRSVVAAQGLPHLLPLDLSYPSIDRLEDFFALVLDGRATGIDGDLEPLLGRYLGATLVEHAHGRWSASGAKDNRGQPGVTSLKDLGNYTFPTMGPIATFKRARIAGHLRDETEIHDLAHHRRQISQLIGSVDEEILALRADLTSLLGSDAGILDFSVESVGMIEEALKRLIESDADRDQRRRVRTRATLYLGAVVQHALGGGEWTLCESPDDVDFGQLRTHNWTPINLVRNTGPKRKPGFIRDNLEFVINARGCERPRPRPEQTATRNQPADVEQTTATVWLALFNRARTPSFDNLATWFTAYPGVTAHKVDEQTLVVTVFDDKTGHTAEVRVILDTAPHVAEEAIDLAEAFGSDRADRDQIANADARLEMTWDLVHSDETYNPMFFMVETLERECGAAIFDATNVRWV